ncbi:unnamed protein product [Victoria cruziana]
MKKCKNYDVPRGVEIRGHYDDAYDTILSKKALQFLVNLHREFRQPVMYVMECRKQAKERTFEALERNSTNKMNRARLEAGVWKSVFDRAEEVANIPRGSIKATVLIETLPAVFQMDEILYELREHSLGLNCGRWDYIFSYVKTFQAHPDRLLPDRIQVGMAQHLMKSYSDLLVYTCHKRGAHAMGGMAAQIPIKDDHVANKAAMDLVFKDKLREVHAGHDGTSAAHPDGPNQIEIKKREDSSGITEDDLLQRPRGTQTLDGLRLNVRVGIQYLAAWLSGTGSVPLYHLMEDAATAEISRVQNWQWIKHGAVLEDEGGIKLKATEMGRIETEVGRESFVEGMFRKACRIFTRQCTSSTLDDFLTLDAYNQIVQFYPEARSKF